MSESRYPHLKCIEKEGKTQEEIEKEFDEMVEDVNKNGSEEEKKILHLALCCTELESQGIPFSLVRIPK